MANLVVSKNAEASFIEKFDINSNKDGKSVSVVNGAVRLMYYESILQDTVKITYTFADTGNTINNKTALEGLPIVGQEKVFVKFKDNNENSLNLTMYVNKVSPLDDDATKSMVQLELVSKEFILNEKVRLNKRFNGKISSHIRNILTDSSFLGTQKKVDIEETSNSYNFIGNNKKPYYTMNWLSKKAVSEKNQKEGDSAGYFFYETSEGFFFKSIDGLLSQEKKKSIIFNQSPDSNGENIPAGYDVKAIEYSKDNRVDIQEKLKMGAFSTRTILFDPFNCFYQVITPNAKQKEDTLKLGGKELPALNPEFNRTGANKEFSRTTYYLIDKGSLPSGTTEQQISKSKIENFKYKDILNQSIMRYNQLFSIKSTVTIPGDFSLHAGDAVFIDAKQLSNADEEINKEYGGLYIIADLCHYISAKETYTKLNLVRDSFGRTGNHTNGKIPL